MIGNNDNNSNSYFDYLDQEYNDEEEKQVYEYNDVMNNENSFI